jgi:hypothetical protein
MISNLIVFSTLFLGVLFTVLYVIRPEFRARIEQPKYAFLQQLSMYDKQTAAEYRGMEGESPAEESSVNDSKEFE